MTGQKLEPGLRKLFNLAKEQPIWVVDEVEAWQSLPVERRMDPGWFHSSSLDHPCDAYLAFEYLGATTVEKLEPRLHRIFGLGNGRDEHWKRYMGEYGTRLSIAGERIGICPGCGFDDREGRHICVPEIRLRGSVDDILRHPQTGEVVIFEFKTKNDGLWRKLESPDLSHIVQTTSYMAATGLTKTHIIYENKNDQHLKEFVIEFDPERWAGIVARLQRILDQLRNGWSPTRTPQSNEANCPHYAICSGFDFAAAKR